jgi:hypothetical protein
MEDTWQLCKRRMEKLSKRLRSALLASACLLACIGAMAQCGLFFPYKLNNPHDPLTSYALQETAGRDAYLDGRGIPFFSGMAVTPDGSRFIGSCTARQGFYAFAPGATTTTFIPLDSFGNGQDVVYNSARGMFALSLDRAIVEIDPATLATTVVHEMDPAIRGNFYFIAADSSGEIFVMRNYADANVTWRQAVDVIAPASHSLIKTHEKPQISNVNGLAVGTSQFIVSCNGSILFFDKATGAYNQEIYWNAGAFANRVVNDDSVIGGLDAGHLRYSFLTSRLYACSFYLAPVSELDPANFTVPLTGSFGDFVDYQDSKWINAALDGSGTLYIANGEGPGFVHRFPGPVTVYRNPPLAADESVRLFDLCAGSDGTIGITDRPSATAKRFDPSTRQFQVIGIPAAGLGSLKGALNIEENSTHLYVLDGSTLNRYLLDGTYVEQWAGLPWGPESLACLSDGRAVVWNNASRQFITLSPGGGVDGPHAIVGPARYASLSGGCLAARPDDTVLFAGWGNDVASNGWAGFGTLDLATHAYAELWTSDSLGIPAKYAGRSNIMTIQDACAATNDFLWLLFPRLSAVARLDMKGTVLGSLDMHREGSSTLAWIASEIRNFSDTSDQGWWEATADRVAVDTNGTLVLSYGSELCFLEAR